ncbi:MAG TPA: hypothetical protein EYQ23_15045, partial [Verrucomicrobiales bacterium]|nr:hypothetical protein [Verrucomicrobiales bacterium]
MRFGDLIKSNYSRFNLSRLFGVGTSAFKVEGDSAKISKDRAKWVAASNKSRKKATEHKKKAETEPLDPEAAGGKKQAFVMLSSAAGTLPEKGYQAGDIIICKPGRRYWIRDKDGAVPKAKKGVKWKRKIRSSSFKMEIKGCWWSKYKYRISKSEKQKFALSNRHPPITKRRKKIMYICELTSDNIAGIPKGLQEFKHLILSHEQISGLHKQTLNKKWTEAMGEESMEVNG